MAGIVAGVGMIVTLHLAPWCRLEAITLNDAPVGDWTVRYPMLHHASIVQQPLSRLSRTVMCEPGVFKVDVQFTGPHSLAIKTNHYRPVCLLLDQVAGDLYGLDEFARLLPLDNAEMTWECPIVTGITAWSLFRPGRHAAIHAIVSQLPAVEESMADLYRLIEEIHVVDETVVSVTLAGAPYALLLRPERFLSGLQQYREFTVDFHPNLKKVKAIDLRFEDLILTEQIPEDTTAAKKGKG